MSDFLPKSGDLKVTEATASLGDRELEVRWMNALRTRDESAFENLLSRYGDKVFAVCLRVLCDRHTAEDVLAEVFWEIWQNPDRYDSSRSSPQTYILLIARSRAIDRLRSLGRQGGLLVNGLAPELENHSVDQTASPGEKASDKEDAQIVREALRHLDAGQREVLELSFFEGLSHQQIADRLQSPLGTVKSRIRQGMSRLRAKVSTYFPEHDQE